MSDEELEIEQDEIQVFEGDNLDEIAMSLHLSPSRLQIINNLYPPVITKDMTLQIEDHSMIGLSNHSVFVVLTSNNTELPGTITFLPEEFVFEQRQLSNSTKLVINVGIINVISCELRAHPKSPDDTKPSSPAVLVVCFLKDPLDGTTTEVLSFAGSRAELHALEYYIQNTSTSMQKEIRYVKPMSAVANSSRMVENAVKAMSVPSRLRAPVANMSTRFQFHGESRIIKRTELIELRNALPNHLKIYSWKKLFCISQNGTSYSGLYAALRHSKRCFMLISAVTGEKIGAFLSAGMKCQEQYYGTGETFVFTFNPNLTVHKWSRNNSNFISSTNKEIMIGTNRAAIYIDRMMLKGISDPSTTFNSPQLTKDPIFRIKEMEIWDVFM